MVLPKKLIFPLIDDLDVESINASLEKPCGVLRLEVLRAKKLVAKDFYFFEANSSDPYVKVQVGESAFYRTETVHKSLNPKWSFSCETLMFGDVHNRQISLIVCDENKIVTDNFLGQASFMLNPVVRQGSMESWLSLERVPTGKVLVRTSWLVFSNKPPQVVEDDHSKDTISLHSRLWSSKGPKFVKLTDRMSSDAIIILHLSHMKNVFDLNQPLAGMNITDKSCLQITLRLGNRCCKSKATPLKSHSLLNWNEYLHIFIDHFEPLQKLKLIMSIVKHDTHDFTDNTPSTPTPNNCQDQDQGNLVGEWSIHLSALMARTEMKHENPVLRSNSTGHGDSSYPLYSSVQLYFLVSPQQLEQDRQQQTASSSLQTLNEPSSPQLGMVSPLGDTLDVQSPSAQPSDTESLATVKKKHKLWKRSKKMLKVD